MGHIPIFLVASLCVVIIAVHGQQNNQRVNLNLTPKELALALGKEVQAAQAQARTVEPAQPAQPIQRKGKRTRRELTDAEYEEKNREKDEVNRQREELKRQQAEEKQRQKLLERAKHEQESKALAKRTQEEYAKKKAADRQAFEEFRALRDKEKMEQKRQNVIERASYVPVPTPHYFPPSASFSSAPSFGYSGSSAPRPSRPPPPPPLPSRPPPPPLPVQITYSYPPSELTRESRGPPTTSQAPRETGSGIKKDLLPPKKRFTYG